MGEKEKYSYTPLKEPVVITEQKWPEGTMPLVHTRTMTYMHEKFIRDCIEGILMQKTTFPVQVLIHDDASTDKTAEIVREYEQKYPCLIKAFYQKENSFTRNNKLELRTEFDSWRIGKYEAMCEGDDYWTDPLKLQKQVDFLEANKEYVLSCHRYRQFDYENNKWFSDNNDKLFVDNKKGFSFVYPFKKWITKTLTLVYRQSALNNMSHYKGNTRDIALVYFLMKNGKGYCFSDNMGVYRLHKGGICSKQSINKKIFDVYHVVKDLFFHEKNNITRNMYYSKYFSVFVSSKGKILFKEKFELPKFLSLFYYFPIKSYRAIKRFYRKATKALVKKE